MSKKPYKIKPSLKVCEYPEELGGSAYISFEEYIPVPGLESVDIRIEFDKTKSFDEVSTLAKQLKKAGFVFVIQK